MRVFRQVIVAVCFMVFAVNVSAEKAEKFEIFSYTTGRQLLNLCSPYSQNNYVCESYIIGSADQLSLVSGLIAQKNKQAALVCIPPDTGMDQVELTVIDFIKNNPKFLNLTASSGVMGALSQAYPCN